MTSTSRAPAALPQFLWQKEGARHLWFRMSVPNPIKGKLLTVDMTNPKAIAAAAQVQRLNAWFAQIDIQGCTFEGFYRLFNQGDQADFDFNKGGRLYSEGDYQRIKKELRREIRINGEPVVEVDVSASHPTIYHANMNAPMLPGFDPYDVPGIPRDIVKSFIVMTLGNGKFQPQWSRPIAKEYQETNGVRLQDAYPLAATRNAILKQLPALELLPESGITWADLQYRESLGLIATIEALAFEHGIPALPLHDSVIVRVKDAPVAEQVLKEQFWKEAGVRIGVKVKG